MKRVHNIQIDHSSREEVLPGFSADFPYIATCAELDRYPGLQAPWHWHGAVELFYIRSGKLEYTTPGHRVVFQAGTGGFVNSNVLHCSKVLPSGENTVQQLHLFDPGFLSGERGSRIAERYILPLTTAPGVELIALRPDGGAQSALLREICAAFDLSEQEWGYELRLREKLCEIWLKLGKLAQPDAHGVRNGGADAQIKGLMVYIQEHYREPICVEELAGQAHISKRACFRLFQEKLHMTPLEYIRSVRLDRACRLLVKTQISMTEIAGLCGLGSSSYFGKLFREQMGCTPRQYRADWQDRDKN